MEYKNLAPELKCQIYSNITNLPDIQALLTTYRHDEEQLALIYDCITTIENVDPVRRNNNSLELEDIEKFRNLQNLKAPVNITGFRDILQLQNLRYLRYLRKLTLILEIGGLAFEPLVNHMLDVIPNNIDRIYFADSARSTIYHYDKEYKFFAIAMYSSDSLYSLDFSVIENLRVIISGTSFDELYIQLPDNLYGNIQHMQNGRRYLDFIVPPAFDNNLSTIISGDSFIIYNCMTINDATRFIIRYHPQQDYIPLVELEDGVDEGDQFLNVLELYGPFTINSFLNVQATFPNLNRLGFYIVERLGATYYHEIVNAINLLNPKIQSLFIYAHPSSIDRVRRYFSQQLAQSRFELQFYPITELESFHEEIVFDTNLFNNTQ